MPDLKNFTITVLANASVTVPRAQISGQVVSSTDQSVVIRDFTGANVINFPADLTKLSAADRRELVELIKQWLVEKLVGLT